MATRRMKRIKRTKKQLHHGRRKTNRRRQRHTRRQRGGAIIKVCEKTHTTRFLRNESNAVGIDITYDEDTHLFKLGTQSTISELETFNGKKRYERAVWTLKRVYGERATSPELDWYHFALFAPIYCHNYTDPQCAQMRAFIESYHTSQEIDKNGAISGRIIATSINAGNNQADKSTYLKDIDKMFGVAPAASAAVAAAAAEDDAGSQNDQIRLERMTGVQGQIKLHFGGGEYILSLNQPLTIPIPPNPKSKQNPIRQLIFLLTEREKQIEGLVNEITFEIVLKNDDVSRCVMRRYEQECQIRGSPDEFNHKTPSIKNHIEFSRFFTKNIISIGSDIIPLMDELQKFANECDSVSLVSKMSSMSIGPAP